METNQKLRVAVIGCGIIAQDHVETIRDKCRSVELCFCDVNPEAMRALEKRYGSKVEFHTDAMRLISAQKFDVVHVLTPPDSHYNISKHAIENGADVLVEKPMALTLEETKSLYLLAQKANRIICVGHSLLYMAPVLKAFEIINSGSLGSLLNVHCFFGHAERGKTIPYGGVSHWAYNIAGGPLTNLISHPASILVELLGKPGSVNVICGARNIMPYGLSDMLNVSIQTPKGHGSFAVSMAHGNSSRYVNIECEKASVYIDLRSQLVIVKSHKGRLAFLSKAFGGIGQGLSIIKGTIGVILKVATGKMKSNPGTRELVARFYNSVCNNLTSPVSKDNTIAVAEILEKFLEVNNAKSQAVSNTQLNPVEAG